MFRSNSWRWLKRFRLNTPVWGDCATTPGISNFGQISSIRTLGRDAGDQRQL
jgi:hypothetical protein